MEAYLTSPALAAAAAAASLSLTADRPDTGHHPMLTLFNTASAARLTGVSAGQSAPPDAQMGLEGDLRRGGRSLATAAPPVSHSGHSAAISRASEFK